MRKFLILTGRCRKTTLFAAVIAAILVLWFAVPPRLSFPGSYSRVVFDRNGRLLRATLAPDEQVRFPPSEEPLPGKYVTAVTTFEDRRYFVHPGIDPAATAKSFLINLHAQRRIRGASTITMQLARLSSRRRRTYFSKILESFYALKLTLHVSKEDLLKIYASNVPMGGNTVGIEAASYRYFGKPLREITWAEAALFAVLPKSPSMINLVSRRGALERRRNRLLATLRAIGQLDSITAELSTHEPLPRAVQDLPFKAPHFTENALRAQPQFALHSSLDLPLQEHVESLLTFYRESFSSYGIRNLAVLVAETESGKVRAYMGSQNFFDSVYSGQVDGVVAQRSTGSLLKPYLVAQVLDRGPFTLKSRLQDVPTFYGSFAPRNASREFDGLVTLEEMLVKSLNVPAVRLLHHYGVADFHRDLRRVPLSGLFRSPEGYGLSLILGGAESNLWDLTQMFAGFGKLGRRAKFSILDSMSDKAPQDDDSDRICSAGSAWLVVNALRNLNRPDAEHYWHLFTEQVPVAWKTGTSYGQKDAWAIGTNQQWTIGVWAGNFDGRTNTMLGGAQSAGPILFALFNALSDKSRQLWFVKPEYDLVEREVCAVSGFLPTAVCTDKELILQPFSAHKHGFCPYHRKILVSRRYGHEICSRCWSSESDTLWKTVVAYPPSVRSILHDRGFPVDIVPVHNASCPAMHRTDIIEVIYPVPGISIIVPRNVRGEYEKVVLKAACSQPGVQLFWYLDGNFIGETIDIHNVAVILDEGRHNLLIQESQGSSESVSFDVFRR